MPERLTDETRWNIEAEAVERVASIIEKRGYHLDPDAGTETGDPAEYFACQVIHYIGQLEERIDAHRNPPASAQEAADKWLAWMFHTQQLWPGMDLEDHEELADVRPSLAAAIDAYAAQQAQGVRELVREVAEYAIVASKFEEDGKYHGETQWVYRPTCRLCGEVSDQILGRAATPEELVAYEFAWGDFRHETWCPYPRIHTALEGSNQ